MNEWEKQLQANRKTPNTPFSVDGVPCEISIGDFWEWAYSDLVANTTRGVVAEFIVACSLNINGGVRDPWMAYDLLTPDGIKVEVKSASYLQSWSQRAESSIVFSIKKSQQWSPDLNELAGPPQRHSDVYVFCHLKHREKHSLDPLNLDQWNFFVLATRTLDGHYPDQKSISLSSLLKLSPEQASFRLLRDAVYRCASR